MTDKPLALHLAEVFEIEGDYRTAAELRRLHEVNAPPQRKWQGLTENEKELLWDEAVEGREHFCSQYGNFADAIEAKLKEKNR
jgi:hypothetical protein